MCIFVLYQSVIERGGLTPIEKIRHAPLQLGQVFDGGELLCHLLAEVPASELQERFPSTFPSAFLADALENTLLLRFG